jgi:agmatine deiminase
MWIGFPSHPELWEDDLAPAQAEVAALAEAIADGGAGEDVWLVAANDEAAATARALAPHARVIVQLFGDVWLRDTGPVVLGGGDDAVAQGFLFNGWGGKYTLDGDATIGARLAAEAGLTYRPGDWVLEGGAIDGDGSGTLLTTEECLLNPNRNPDLDREGIEARLARDLGATRVIWLGAGLRNDHTDGHVDNLARFVAPGTVAIPEAEADDPNADAFADAAEALLDAELDVVAIPSVGLLEDEDGEPIPASYMNFLIANRVVAVPQYGAPNDEAALAAIQALFPDRRAVGLPANHLLTGGGSFHCISQQVPA